jgi:sugar O-acyltransferase (sialic acid O-acetyltransferase NeuD family)
MTVAATYTRPVEIPKHILLYGGTGQAKVVKPIVEYYGSKVIAVFDDTGNLDAPFKDVDLFCSYESLLDWKEHVDIQQVGYSITIGNPHGEVRLEMHEKLYDLGFVPTTLIHPNAIIADNCEIGIGSQIMAGAIIMPEAKIGKQSIINTNASIDHECRIGDGCEVAPGATLCGCVSMKRNSWVCAGATVLPHKTIGANSIVGAGAVVIDDIPDNQVVVGVPAKPIMRNNSSE